MIHPSLKNIFIRLPFLFSILFFGISDTSAREAVSETTISICSWNLKDFGRSKSDAEIAFIANTIKDFDIVMIQEVVAGDPAGAQAVGRLGEALSRTGAKWEYRVSDATSGINSYKRERYAFLWKPSKATLVGKPWLERQYEKEIDREPFFATFAVANDSFTLVNFHAITKSMQPETEIKYFKYLPAEYPTLNLLFCGDFNVPQSHSVFIPLRKMGYTSALVNQKTSLKMECVEAECLASEFDNIYYDSARISKIDAAVIPFFKTFVDLQEARLVSDHLPIFLNFKVNANQEPY